MITNTKDQFRVERITADSSLLEDVISLHRANAKNLGMFPKGAFREHADSKLILVAICPERGCLGYLLYREARERATIVHLCVQPAYRGKGVARALVDRLKNDTRHLRGIGLCCRRDYKENAAWPKFGFAAVATKRGRGHDGAELEFWWLDHNHPDLFSLSTPQNAADAQLRVVIDANVFYDLHERTTRESEDSKALLADWLQESVELCLTTEIYNEIRRAPTDEQRQRSRSLVSRHRVLKTDDPKVQSLIAELESRFPEATCLRDDSDLRQVAHSIAADVPFFVTRDEKLIERCEALFDRYGLRVLQPTDLINELDSLRREAEYRPVRLEGSRLTANLLRAEQVESVVSAFQHCNQERAGEFEKSLRHYLATPNDHECRLVMSGDKVHIALTVQGRPGAASLEVPFFRLTAHSLAPTIGRHLLRSMIEKASKVTPLVKVTEPGIDEKARLALIELGFVPSPEGWWKISMGRLGAAETMKTAVRECGLSGDLVAGIAAGLDDYSRDPTAMSAAQIEKVFWPAKLTDTVLPTFIVPIQAQWAQHFFDSELGSELLFGLNEELHLGIEGAYYCSKRNTILEAPARVLWYVSKGPEGRGSMSIKACSRIEEVFLGKPKEVFKKFSRLGVYQWRDIFKAVEGNLDEPLLAFRFSMTERFVSPVGVEELKRLGILPPIMSPRKTTADQFAEIYRLGKGM
jgi:GNAT superfamily N-acetyltransferase